jgi:hypothetical protein
MDGAFSRLADSNLNSSQEQQKSELQGPVPTENAIHRNPRVSLLLEVLRRCGLSIGQQDEIISRGIAQISIMIGQ